MGAGDSQKTHSTAPNAAVVKIIDTASMIFLFLVNFTIYIQIYLLNFRALSFQKLYPKSS